MSEMSPEFPAEATTLTPIWNRGVERRPLVLNRSEIGAERHVDHVDMVGRVAVVVRVDRAVDRPVTTSVLPSQPKTLIA